MSPKLFHIFWSFVELVIEFWSRNAIVTKSIHLMKCTLFVYWWCNENTKYTSMLENSFRAWILCKPSNVVCKFWMWEVRSFSLPLNQSWPKLQSTWYKKYTGLHCFLELLNEKLKGNPTVNSLSLKTSNLKQFLASPCKKPQGLTM